MFFIGEYQIARCSQGTNTAYETSFIIDDETPGPQETEQKPDSQLEPNKITDRQSKPVSGEPNDLQDQETNQTLRRSYNDRSF